MDRRTQVIAARWILPVSREPFEFGWVRLQDDRIVEIGKGAPPKDAHDLGDAALLPGLVNAHTHLEFSDCQSPIGESGVPLHRWIGQVVAARGRTDSDSRHKAIKMGLAELSQTGTRLVGEITTPPCVYPPTGSGPTVISFPEVLGLSAERSDERILAAQAQLESLPAAGISPHAPYSTSLATIDKCVAIAKENNRTLAMHVAESPAERELLADGSGPFADTLRAMGVWRDGLFPWGDQPLISLIARLGWAPRVLLVHGNDLTDVEISELVRHPNITVIYCPRTHHFFRYPKHPVDRLLRAGVPVALGTDSRASNPNLNLWDEVRFLLQHRTDLNPAVVLAMATINGADALGHDEFGRIDVGCRSELGFVRTNASTPKAVYEALAESTYVSL